MPLPDATTSLQAWTQALAQPAISPAGGSAAALAGSMAASLVAMVAGMTAERVRYQAVHPEAQRIRAEADRLRVELLELACEDAQVLAELSQALGLPKDTEPERAERERQKHQVFAEGARVQLEVAGRAAMVAELGGRVAMLAPPSTTGDAASAVFLAAAAVRSASWAARIDAPEKAVAGAAAMTDEAVTPGASLLDQVETAERLVSRILEEGLS